MNVIDFLRELISDEDARAEYAEDPNAYTSERLPDTVTGADVLAALPEVCSTLPPEQAGPIMAAYGQALHGSSAPAPAALTTSVSSAPPPPPAPDPGASDLDTAVEQITHFTNVYETVNQTYHEENTNIDNSIRPNITADGDVDLDIDSENTNVTGDDNAVADDGGTANSGDGAVVAGDDIEDSQVVTGNVGGSVVGGDVEEGAVLGNDNQVLNAEGDVGAAAFGGGDATNVDTDGGNAVLGDDNILLDDTSGNVGFGSGDVIDAGGGNVNTGSGDLTNIENSDLDEVAIGGGDVTSTEISADDGSSVAYGAGASSEATTTEVDVEGSSIDGNLQVAGGDNADQTALNDESLTVEDSFNTDYTYETEVNVEDSFQDNSDNSTEVDVEDSFQDNSDNSTDVDVL